MDILSFSSPKNDAALTFVNSTTVNGVLLNHGRAWDVVASDGLLKVIGKLYKFELVGKKELPGREFEHMVVG